ncbi:MAG: acetyl-CoA carboxylase, carboxyltransferase subunit beta [Candidatus Methylacidiphilales bacterium]
MRNFGKPRSVGEAPNRNKKREIPEGLWTKCPNCGEVLFHKELENNLRTCPHCNHHMHISAIERILQLCDEESFSEIDSGMRAVDVLGFKAQKSYEEKISRYRQLTGLNDSVVAGSGKMDGRLCSFAVMDFRFAAGSMGSVAGEKITRAIELGLKEKCPVIIFCASGGARMEEGIFSLMQMAKTSAALARLKDAGLPYISVLTNPTTGGVTASFATLGDLILAEPKAMIGFAGPRVIKETTRQDLPEGFQTAEFLNAHGLIDRIVHRKEMRTTLVRSLNYLCP